MKKKVEDLTIKEIMSFCNEQKNCLDCPLNKEICLEDEFCPAAWFVVKEELKETEIEIPNKWMEMNKA